MSAVTGLHHITIIAGDPGTNLRFYRDVLGLKLVKRTVNQDVPDTYHLFYADAVGSPGTDITFFPWPDQPPGHGGVGLTMEVGLAIPSGSSAFWRERLNGHGTSSRPERRFGEDALVLTDPHGVRLALVEVEGREMIPWPQSPVPEEQQIRGLHGARLWERSAGPTTLFLEEGLGLNRVGTEGPWIRYQAGEGGSGRWVDVLERPDVGRGTWGVGSVHHIAWRVPDRPAQLEMQRRVAAAGVRPTEVIDRFWFSSIYFKEPGGALFEIATDGPGFTVDESPEHLGERLILPPWLEPHRKEIEAALPPLPGSG
jgi:glyoxalase family protein